MRGAASKTPRRVFASDEKSNAPPDKICNAGGVTIPRALLQVLSVNTPLSPPGLICLACFARNLKEMFPALQHLRHRGARVRIKSRNTCQREPVHRRIAGRSNTKSKIWLCPEVCVRKQTRSRSRRHVRFGGDLMAGPFAAAEDATLMRLLS